MPIRRLGMRFDLLGGEGSEEETIVNVGHLVREVSVWHRRHMFVIGGGKERREGKVVSGSVVWGRRVDR
jgi:hypothetical protein